jgi:hypothetical protein
VNPLFRNSCMASVMLASNGMVMIPLQFRDSSRGHYMSLLSAVPTLMDQCSISH